MPEPEQALHRDGVVCLPLGDAKLSTPVIMNRRAGDESPLLTQFRGMVAQGSRERAPHAQNVRGSPRPRRVPESRNGPSTDG